MAWRGYCAPAGPFALIDRIRGARRGSGREVGSDQSSFAAIDSIKDTS
jgi:hypothetical protein